MSIKERLEEYRAARADVIAEADLVLKLSEVVAKQIIPLDAAAAEAVHHASVRLGTVTIPAYTGALTRLQTDGGK